ncbi:MAG TPA: dihydrodipicolinate synthase family protein [Candidatus Latescibacteria bacterium]|nr:dihydrodipicolinate synthase family protein [Candidatus Latescibacterota bacterium]MDP7635193.1 dihydrodipicolinate synthase family protein [Candidatus Latescibacterota bacterium]HJN29445.1 dihydrodipicolinate synthase family protein [Candidatus Latescibacterota bacterium]
MDFSSTRQGLSEHVVAVPTTIWQSPGELDVAANVANAEFLFKHGVTAAVFAGGVGEHDRLTTDQQKELLGAIGQAAKAAGSICLGTGLGRTLERVREVTPALAEAGVHWAMLMPSGAEDPAEQFDYFNQVIPVIRDHGIWPVLYPRPEQPIPVAVIERLFDSFEIPAVKLANNGMLLNYAEMVGRLGHDRSAWLCGTAGWWMPAYHSVRAARGMSSGIVDAFPDKPLGLLKRILDGSFEPDADYWTMVRIEQIRQREKSYVALVIKHLQGLVGLKGGMNGDGAELPDAEKAEVEKLVRDAGWL